MVEIILAVTQVVTFIAVLVFFFFRERERQTYQQGLESRLSEFPRLVHENTSQVLSKMESNLSKVLEKTTANSEKTAEKTNTQLAKMVEAIGDQMVKTIGEVNTHVTDTASLNFSTYLKHIRELEKMILPRPITSADVEAVMGRGPQIMSENEISKLNDDGGFSITDDNFKDIPFGPSTNVKFEFTGGDIPSVDMPTVVE